MRPFYIVGNLKMNLLGKAECDKYLALLKKELAGKNFSRVKAIIAPPAIHLPYFAHLPKPFLLGAQNVFWERNGAFTGEISPLMLKDARVEYVLVGHSERRTLLGETNEMIKLKIDILDKHLMTPILCIGETRAERDRDETTNVLEAQIRAVFVGLSHLQAEKIIIAYEPRWAIGTDRVPTTTEILQVKVFLRKLFTALFDSHLADRITVIYGGSVKTNFLPQVTWEAEMDGALVGRESLSPLELIKMMELAENHLKKK